jgi:translocation protein SEC62
MNTIMPYTFFLLVDRGGRSGNSKSPKLLQINPVQKFSPEGYYAWFYEGSQWLTYVGGLALVACMLAGVMFPLWPSFMRLGVWYLSMLVLAFLAALFALAIIRLIVYVITVFAAPPGLWIFPQLFADVGFVSHLFDSRPARTDVTQFESFVPLYEWDYPKKKGKKGKGKEKEKEDADSEKKSKRSKSGSPYTAPAALQSASIEEVEDD